MKLCPLCKRGDIWQEAVCRTEQVYNGQTAKDGKEVVDYLLAEVQVMLEQANAQPAEKTSETCKWKRVKTQKGSPSAMVESPHNRDYIESSNHYCPTCGLRIEVVE